MAQMQQMGQMPAGMGMGGYPGMMPAAPVRNAKAKAKAKAKRKAAKKARKKSRKK